MIKDKREVLSGQWIIVLNEGNTSHLRLTENCWVSRQACQEQVAQWLSDEKYDNVEVNIRQRRRGDLPWLSEVATHEAERLRDVALSRRQASERTKK